MYHHYTLITLTPSSTLLLLLFCYFPFVSFVFPPSIPNFFLFPSLILPSYCENNNLLHKTQEKQQLNCACCRVCNVAYCNNPFFLFVCLFDCVCVCFSTVCVSVRACVRYLLHPTEIVKTLKLSTELNK